MTDPTPLMTARKAGTIARSHGYRALVIIGVRYDGVVDVMSHGRDQEDCRVIGDWAQGAGLSRNLSVVPFQTWFGWGNGGVPKALTREEIESLSPGALGYAANNTHKDAER